MSENLKILERLTEQLSSFPVNVSKEGGGGSIGVCWQEYRMIKGRSKARNLLSLPGKISVAQWWNSEGSEFPEHEHMQKEHLLVFDGEMHLFVEGKMTVLKDGDGKYIAPGMRHNAFFPKNTHYIATTIPDNEEWPS